MIITTCSTKGGVGKTTLTANLAGLLADAGYRTLVIDADIQPTLSSYYPIESRAAHGLYQLVTTGAIDDTISQTTIDSLDIVISDDPDGNLDNWILHSPDGRIRMRRALTGLDAYDFVLVDTQGAIGPLQDLGVLAADILISPIPPEILSAREFARGTLAMLERLQPMQHMGAPVGHLYGLCYRMDRTVDARNVADTLRRATFGDSRGAITILDTVIPATVAYREAATARTPVHQWERRRDSQATPAARETMLQLVNELLPHAEVGCEADMPRATRPAIRHGQP
ncbi:ParA family protein [Salinisphaera orenii]|uniref:ParA family protein n=1 Tax=Salinisphaera orenii TaxID=856731 RepID=UPI000DBE91AC